MNKKPLFSKFEYFMIFSLIGGTLLMLFLVFYFKIHPNNVNNTSRHHEIIQVEDNIYKTDDNAIVYEERLEKIIIFPKRDLKEFTLEIEVYDYDYNYLDSYSIDYDNIQESDIISIYFNYDLKIPRHYFLNPKKLKISYIK